MHYEKRCFRVGEKTVQEVEVTARLQPCGCTIRKLTLLRYIFFVILSGSVSSVNL